ncbi:MAG: hypothetical protein ACREVA_11695 [Burkholderiales bacterium]
MQFYYPLNWAIDYGKGLQVEVGQVAGPREHFTAYPRPYPWSDSIGIMASYGMRLVPPGYGDANWGANIRPLNNRIPDAGYSGIIHGLIKNPIPYTSF